MTFEASFESIRQHQVPAWFHDAKLGIFVHWGLYSIPGWAPTTGELPDVIANEGASAWFARNPYAEWYANTIRIPKSESAAYHAQHYGADFKYEQFAPQFNQGVQSWNPDSWADLFKSAGARYVVLTTKHHDGFLLWPSATPNPFHTNYQAARDLVGELTDAVRSRGLRMGLYYSGGLDWTFNPYVIRDMPDLFRAVPQSAAYVAYADAHWYELIERYTPSVLWNDIAYPRAADLPALVARYYNSISEGIINDRFLQASPDQQGQSAEQMLSEGALPRPQHYDFRTPEYAIYTEIREEKWESCRGLGYSFGYNRNETAETMLSADELIRSFVDLVSKNGNLLINVGPTGDGSIPQEQAERLQALGAWLDRNGEAIYATRPWSTDILRSMDGIALRFTQRDQRLYAMLLGTPAGTEIVIDGLSSPAGEVRLLGHEQALEWEHDGQRLTIHLSAPLPPAPAHALSLPLPG